MKNFAPLKVHWVHIQEFFVSLYWRMRIRRMADFYLARTDRNRGWLTAADQFLLKESIVCIAGCGGMGGLLAATLARLGVGEIRIADSEVFDISNLNRQFGATTRTIGKNKARATGAMIRRIAPDTKLVIEEHGITEETADAFVKDAHLICDEIEFWAAGSRILLHRNMRTCGSMILNAPTVGHSVYVTKFTPSSMTIEEVLGMDYEEAKRYQTKIQNKTASPEDIRTIMEPMIRFAAPEGIPEYSAIPERYSTVAAVKRRLSEETTASIIATNVPMATGFLANQVLFHLLERSETPRIFAIPPEMPGYISFDAAHLTTKKVDTIWFNLTPKQNAA